ncbi:hypothetical protein Cgig2_013777 [Carnegiea gigantea]|uniref:PPM-type phosphatase domain-containing protein n=1 Tax=Carnegiea gigantea TaxID=171969 RepID=A0A9Q1K7G0_9CARY|nr:hypothetical protein Cgig2_013777 [Carnegiea gigantea]
MNCAIVVQATFSPSNINASTNNVYNTLPPIMSPGNKDMMLKLPQLEAPFSTSHYHHHHPHVHKELPLLKRKRPARINVPLSNLLEGFASSPRDGAVDKLEEVDVEGDGYGIYCKRGRLRAQMEDRYSVLVDEGPHSSKQAAEFAATRLGKNILDYLGQGETKTETEIEYEKLIEEKIREGYLATDEEFLRSENAVGGTCCATALIQQGKLIVSNVGDCRAVISRGGVAEAVTIDHTPVREDEKIRIEAQARYVDCCSGVWRVQGSLAVSRAIGNQHLKQWVTAEPDTKIINIQPDCEFLILASDGLWDKISNQEAIDIVRPFSSASMGKPHMARACEKLVELSMSRGSSDDTSVMIVRLVHFVN